MDILRICNLQKRRKFKNNGPQAKLTRPFFSIRVFFKDTDNSQDSNLTFDKLERFDIENWWI